MIDIKFWYKKFKYTINDKYLILLVLAGLHYHKKITDEKLKGQFKSLRNGTLQKKKGTYHCEINDHWYNDESAYNIFLECLEDKNVSTIPYKEFIKYIHLFENQNFNHALNVFGAQYIYQMLKNWNPEYHEDFTNYIKFYIPEIKITNHSSYCYECGTKHDHYVNNMKDNTKILNQWIHNQKKGNLSKIPLYYTESQFGSFCY